MNNLLKSVKAMSFDHLNDVNVVISLLNQGSTMSRLSIILHCNGALIKGAVRINY